MLDLAYQMGLSTLEPTTDNLRRFGLSVTLGGGEVKLIDLAYAYGVFANGGVKSEPVAILKVVDQKGKTLFEHKATSGKRVLGEDISFLITSILSDNDARKEVFGERNHLNIPGKYVFAKTGTTDDKRDNWTIGGTRNRIVGTWVGNNDNSPMHPSLSSGVTGAAPIWNQLIKEAIKDTPNEAFIRPANIYEMDIDTFGGALPSAHYPTRKEFFIKGTEPNGLSPIYQKLKLSRSNGKLANQIEIASGNFEEKEFIVFKESDPISSDGRNRWQEGIDAWLTTQPDANFHPPTETSSESEDHVVLSLTSPEDKKQYDDHDVKVSANAFSLNSIKEIIVYIDDQEYDKTSSDRYSNVLNLNKGPHSIRVVARDNQGKEASQEVRIGVKVPWDFNPSPTPKASPKATPSSD
ncbi:hypothetical protein HY408_00080 [Candidatus Gottesmanbacteria bacterium]|nr:hypothetical protein [Candidatus Gottesmanbacteria bacterium]